MTIAALITQLRNQTGDTRRRMHVDWTGDGSTTVFQCPDDTFPILDQVGTYQVKVTGTGKTETTDYVLDKEAGTLTLNSAPTNGQAVTLDHSAVYLTDVDWIFVIAGTINSMGDQYTKEFIDTSLSATVGMLELALATPLPNCIALYDFGYRETVSSDWKPVSDLCNWRYSKDENKIFIGTNTAFTAAWSLRLRGLNALILPTAVTDTLDVPSQYLRVLEYGCNASYWKWRYKSVVQLVSKMTTENTRTPLQELIMLSDRFDRLFELEKSKNKPQRPARIIPAYKEGGGRP